MKSRVIIAIIVIFTICSFRMTSKNNSIANSSERISNGYWIHKDVKGKITSKFGPFIRLNDSTIFTVDGNKGYISTNQGKTWIGYSTIVDTTKFKIMSGALIRTRSGVIILSFSNLKGKANWDWQDSIHDFPGAILPTYAIRSLDDGKTWQDLQKLHNDWTGANRDMIETNDGSVVFTSMIMRHNPGHHTVVTYTTNDDGKTWKQSNIIDLGGSGTHGGVMESTLVQLKDGQLWMLLRTNFGNFWQAFSKDDGLTWQDIGPTNIDASSSPGIVKRLKDGRIVLVWNRLYLNKEKSGPLRGGKGNLSEFPASWQRSELSIMFSNDEGNSWSTPVVIAKATEKGRQLSYPEIFEIEPGKLWITTRHGAGKRGGLSIILNEEDFVKNK